MKQQLLHKKLRTVVRIAESKSAARQPERLPLRVLVSSEVKAAYYAHRTSPRVTLNSQSCLNGSHLVDQDNLSQ